MVGEPPTPLCNSLWPGHLRPTPACKLLNLKGRVRSVKTRVRKNHLTRALGFRKVFRIINRCARSSGIRCGGVQALPGAALVQPCGERRAGVQLAAGSDDNEKC